MKIFQWISSIFPAFLRFYFDIIANFLPVSPKSKKLRLNISELRNVASTPGSIARKLRTPRKTRWSRVDSRCSTCRRRWPTGMSSRHGRPLGASVGPGRSADPADRKDRRRVSGRAGVAPNGDPTKAPVIADPDPRARLRWPWSGAGGRRMHRRSRKFKQFLA